VLDASNIHKHLSAIDEDLENERWEEARTKLNPMVSSGLYLPREENIHSRLARACRETGDTTAEQYALETVVAHESGSLNAVSRLLEIAREKEDWEAVDNWADHWLAINPVAETPWRALLTAGENTGNADRATKAGATLLLLDPPDRAAVHYRIARQYQVTEQTGEARRNVLLALEEAPRYRKAHALLAELSNSHEKPIEIEDQNR
jgi:tetratricopeptide (TPR) repeat protein